MNIKERVMLSKILQIKGRIILNSLKKKWTNLWRKFSSDGEM